MKRMFVLTGLATLLAASAVQAAPIVLSGTSTSAAGIQSTRDAFRLQLGGGIVPGVNPGSFVDGTGARREINWDGVGDAFATPNFLPANFFNVNSPRGVILTAPGGTGVQVSANAGVQPVDFSNINATYLNTFAPFSTQRLFAPIGSNVTDVTFFVPGTTTPAATRGFGSIFSDVDLPNVTSLQFFDVFNNSLGTFFVPALAGSETLEFLGVIFDAPVINRVRITTGNAALGAGVNDGGGTDLVVMDDFLYSEPQAVPEPASLILLGTGAIAIAGLLRRRVRK